jgi:hypothetical protein
MAFKSGKGNVWVKKDAEIARLKAEIERLHDVKYIRQFADELTKNIGTMLAVTPFSKWPEMAKVAYRHAERDQEVSAWVYRKYCALET